MSKKNLDRMREKSTTGFGKGTWFSTVPENKETEILGMVHKIFKYHVEGKPRVGLALDLAIDIEFHYVESKEVQELVEMKQGEQLLIPVSGQLSFILEEEAVSKGDMLYLRYEGKDEDVTFQGQHPHRWAYTVEKAESEQSEESEKPF